MSHETFGLSVSSLLQDVAAGDFLSYTGMDEAHSFFTEVNVPVKQCKIECNISVKLKILLK